MRLKSLAAAAALALATVAGAGSQAEAKTRVFIGVGFGSPFYEDCGDSFIFDRCRGPWPGYGFHHPSYHRPHFFDSPRYYRSHKLSCDGAIWSLREHGYSRVRVLDCAGNFYSFTAKRGGHRYKIKFNAVTGHASRTRT